MTRTLPQRLYLLCYTVGQGKPPAPLAARFAETVPGLRKALRDSYLSSRAVGGGWSA